MQNTQEENENETRFTQAIIDEIEIFQPVHLIGDPAFTDEDGNLKIIERRVVTPDGYNPESTDPDVLDLEIAQIVKYELKNNIQNDVVYLMKYRYTLNQQTNELKVVVHGIY